MKESGDSLSKSSKTRTTNISSSIINSKFLKKLDVAPVVNTSLVKPAIDGFGPFDLQISEITILKNKKLGAGAYGEVHMGICRGFEVAVKTLKNMHFDPGLVEGFKRECIIMRNLVHANILLFMGACLEHNHYYLVTELAPRGSLDGYLHRKEDEPAKEKLNFLRKMSISHEVAQGMNWLHKQNLLHLDLKPANLLLMEDWTVKIADFGLSRLQPKNDQDIGTVGGTLLYMAPESFNIKPLITVKCDVYAYGIILWEILTERYPYDQKYKSLYLLQKAVKDASERPEITEAIPRSLADLMQMCWHPNPDKRLTFAEILQLAGGNIFNKTASEVVASKAGNSMGEQISAMWENFGKKGSINAVPWEPFAEQFAVLMKTKKDSLEMKCLGALLDIDQNNRSVTWKNFDHFVNTFGPLEPEGQVTTVGTLSDLVKLVKEDWFWGGMSSEEAMDVLRNTKPGTYLVRFSANAVGCFTLSYKHPKESKVMNKRYDKHQIVWQTLGETIKKEKKVMKLKSPAENRPPRFLVLFTKHTASHSNYEVSEHFMDVATKTRKGD
uniref:Non-specific protein-tyrosine kinase n=1 Tax=Arcella intermedia TaxID=1963864 RepID=A0A6B2L155_9EUKA